MAVRWRESSKPDFLIIGYKAAVYLHILCEDGSENKFSGEECDDQQDGATTGGPFSALCESMRPDEEEREAGDEEVGTEKICPRCFNFGFRR